MDGSPILPTGAYVPHPHAELFPMMDGEAFAALTDDIREHGIREPVVMLDGMVLDGRNRYLAARQCGALIPTVEFDGADPLAFVISLNLKRRHLTESQRAMVASKIAKLPDGHRQVGQLADVPTQAQAAEMMNVGERSVRRATEVHERGAPALVAEVEAGHISVSAAAEVARLPEIEQVEIVAAGPEAVREVAAVQRSGAPDAEREARRKALIAAAEAGLRPERSASRRNPDYVPNPIRTLAGRVFDHCGEISAAVVNNSATALVATLQDDAERARAISAVEAAQIAITELLEAARG